MGSFNIAHAVSAQSGPYEIQLSTVPEIVPVGKAQLFIHLESQGKPVIGADVKALAAMPDMPMGERAQMATPPPDQPGTYVAPVGFAMQGNFEVSLTINAPQGNVSVKIPLQTGQNTASQSSFSWKWIAVLIALFIALAFVIYRMKVTGQRWPREIFRPSILIGVLALIVLLAIAIYATRHFRRAGTMTPVQAMGMSMDMPAPAGALPVQLASVRRGTVADQVVYSGQTVGYVQQDIYPRVTGVIQWMPFYAGDHIKKGQLLARLDSSQYDLLVAAQSANARQAEQQIGIARSENSAAQAQVGEASAQTGAQSNTVAQTIHMADEAKAVIRQKQSTLNVAQNQQAKMRAELQEMQSDFQASFASQNTARNEVTVAQRTQAAAQADAAAAKTGVNAANAQLASAQADLEYRQQEIVRAKVLLQGGAASEQSYQSATAQYKIAAAKVDDAKAQVQHAQAALNAAQATARVASAKIRSAQSEVAKATAESTSRQARIAKAKASLGKSTAQIAAAKAEVDQARAAANAAKSQVDVALSNLKAQRESKITASANATAASQRIGAAQAGASAAQAQLSSAETTKGYTLIRSNIDGVVMRRLISPGVLVQPGQAILQVAQINPIRVQANVAEDDLARIHVGSSVSITASEDHQNPVHATVTSITPAVDAASHTGMVEAIVSNSKNQFLPGEYVQMSISVGQQNNILRVPSNAIQWFTNPGKGVETTSEKPYVWIAAKGQNNTFTAHRVVVRLGMSNGDETAVLSGLQEGQRIVLGNQQNLQEGMALVASKSTFEASA
jgi:RND family efflux transporter MFP subunit